MARSMNSLPVVLTVVVTVAVWETVAVVVVEVIRVVEVDVMVSVTGGGVMSRIGVDVTTTFAGRVTTILYVVEGTVATGAPPNFVVQSS